ncbi:MAG: DEAD/DEAH box helicase family protein [Actinomycetota bacterium]|nr:DEAD/DEAH box helicase family protein [Actinomycetota bacterium]
MLADDLATALRADPGLTTAELADRLGSASEQAVSFALFAGHDRFRRNQTVPPRWWLAPSTTHQTGLHRAGLHPVGPERIAAPAVVAGKPPFGLYAWQADALAAWAAAGRRGVIEAVTGTGKTMVGVAAALQELAQRGQVLVLVPTVELQRQWVTEMTARLATASAVGRLGAGSSDSLASHDVLVAIVNSARAIDVRPIRRGGLLVADECHRYGSSVNHLALDGRFRHRLGLSATYARDDDGNLAWLDPYFGGTCLRLGYRRALAEQITARFTVTLLGVRFAPDEQARYQELSDLMAGLRARLVRHHGLPADPFELFMRAVAQLADGDGEGAGAARSYRQAMLERRRLLADTPAKDHALATLAPAIADADRAIVFTQTIAASQRASQTLAERGLRAGCVHSGLASSERHEVLSRFAGGDLKVLAAPRVLDEGIDVPAADVAVIAAASRSRRQMVQRMGRVLRRKPDGRRARFAVLFVEGTVEDPSNGAHEVFLAEMADVADRVSRFPSGTLVDRPGGPRDTLRPSWPANDASRGCPAVRQQMNGSAKELSAERLGWNRA